MVVVDNGSPVAVDAQKVRRFGDNFSCHRFEPAHASPVAAINWGVSLTKGEVVGLLVDGARLVTPGLLSQARRAFAAYSDPTVLTQGWHLGPAAQQLSIDSGYCRETEDELLERIDWPHAGYRLFEIATPAPSAGRGIFLPMSESNALFIARSSFDELGGFDPAFDTPGGGYANPDFCKRAVERDAPLVVLLGEASFHQIHGGVSTNVSVVENGRLCQLWDAEYRRIRGVPWSAPTKHCEFLGSVPSAYLPSVLESARIALGEDGEKPRRID